jgi:signal transduction histidine kinase
MKLSTLWPAAVLAGGFATGLAVAADAAKFGSAAEAKAMLQKAALEVKKDKAAALAKFNKGEAGFKDRDLYPFCASLDGTTTAHPAMLGRNLKELKDKSGKAFGVEMFQVAEEGKVKEVAYMWPRPGSDTPVQKVSYVTKVGDQVCGVGYYK